MVDFYDTRKKKVVDFMKGLTLNVLIGMILLALLSTMSWTSQILSTTWMEVLASAIIPLALVILEIILLIRLFPQRRYIAIGMLASFILPLLLVGACFIAFNILF
ncbi:MAG: hypothetical protein ABIH34_01760 [Nanoarchaeota archaeon]